MQVRTIGSFYLREHRGIIVVNHGDPDRSVDRLLGRAFSSDAAASEACLDAETIAAFVEGTLPGAARASAEAHAASCGRCQQVLAAFVRTDEDRTGAASARARSPRPRLAHVRWLVPLAGVAAAAALFVATRPAAPPAIPNRPTALVAEPTPGAGDEKRADLQARQEAAPQSGATPAAAPSAKQKTAEREMMQKPADRSEADASRTRAAREAPRVDVLDRTTRASPPAFNPADALAPEGVMPTPDPSIRWRIEAGRRLQRSTDAGVTWTTAHSAPDGKLAAGYCPAPSICWVVGTAGTVLRTVDGSTWQRMPFPEVVDLTEVRASDGDTAVVTAVDGRRFSTKDGGRTWDR